MHTIGVTCTCAFLLMLYAAAVPCAEPSVVVLDFELVDELHDPNSVQTDMRRLLAISALLRDRLRACKGLTIDDPQAAQAEIDQAIARNRYTYRCNGCTQTIAQGAHAQYVLFPWVQRVSNLILNVNAEVRAAEDGELVAVRSVDIRGNTDKGWSRGVAALALRLCEKDVPALSRAKAQ